MSKSQRDKGKRGERELANVLRAWGYSARRGNQSDGAHECDVEAAAIPWWIECKRGKSIRFWEAFAQADSDAVRDNKHRAPAVVFRRDGDTQWRVVLHLEEALELLDAALSPIGTP